jgi:hypothetical protein
MSFVVEQDAGRDQHVLKRAVLVAEAGPIIVQRLALRQTIENVLDDVGVGVELGDVVRYILLAGVAEGLIIGAVGPKDGPIGGDPMQPDHPVVELIDHIPLRTDNRVCLLHGAPSCLAPANNSRSDKASRQWARSFVNDYCDFSQALPAFHPVELERHGRDEPTSLRGRLNSPVRRLPDQHDKHHEMGDQQPGHGHGRNKIGGPEVANPNPLHTLNERIQ